MPKVMLEGFKCGRCGHTWIPRSTTEGEPTICPRCKSPYWNKERKVGKMTVKMGIKPIKVKSV